MDKPNIIVDLDGTLCDLTHRLHHIKDGRKNWAAFHAGCKEDAPVPAIIKLVYMLWHAGHVIHILGGRNKVAESDTINWLARHGIVFNTLSMRAIGDRRDDVLVKQDMIQKLGLTPENTLFCLDDRQRDVDMWRELGFTCLQVNAWKE